MILWNNENRIGGKLSWKGFWVVCGLSSCSKQAQLCSHTSSLRALSSWAFETSEDRDCANLTGSQSHWLAALTRNTFFYVSTQSLLFQIMNGFTTTCNSCGYFPWSNRNVGRGVKFSSVTATKILQFCAYCSLYSSRQQGTNLVFTMKLLSSL